MTQDSITGLLLAGIGHVNEQQKKNFLIVDSSKCSRLPSLFMRVFYASSNDSISNLAEIHSETQVSIIESAFEEFTERKDIAILLINQHVCKASTALASIPSSRQCQLFLCTVDRREDPANGRQVPTSLSRLVRDSLEGSSLRYVMPSSNWVEQETYRQPL